MTPNEIRNWIGKYYLVATTVIGAYILVLGGTKMLPIPDKDAISAFQIVVPFFTGQLVMAFQWFTQPSSRRIDTNVPLPSWVVKWPPFAVTGILALAVVAAIVCSSLPEEQQWINAGRFKVILTFCVSLLSATTVFVTGRYFASATEAGSDGQTIVANGGVDTGTDNDSPVE